MGLFKKKADPITERARALSAEIAALESKIQRLSREPAAPAKPKPEPAPTPAPPPKKGSPFAAPKEPVFERVDQKRLEAGPESLPDPHYNELGVRKYNLPEVMRRWKNLFRPSPPANPKLVNYLAAGSIQGLRPLRYEKRVARNRFLLLAAVLLLVLIGIISALVRQ